MKALKSLLNRKKIAFPIALDDKTIFYVFQKVIREDFGNIGSSKFTPDYFSRKVLFVKSNSSAWGSELWMNRKKIIDRINKEIGENILDEIKLK